jgi:hypothetical protein
MDDPSPTGNASQVNRNPETPSPALPVLEYNAAGSKPLLAKVRWKRFWQGFLLAVVYGPLAAIAWFFYADLRSSGAIRAPITKEAFAWLLAAVFVLLLASIQRRTTSWSLAAGALAGAVLVPLILAAMFIVALSLSPIR